MQLATGAMINTRRDAWSANSPTCALLLRAASVPLLLSSTAQPRVVTAGPKLQVRTSILTILPVHLPPPPLSPRLHSSVRAAHPPAAPSAFPCGELRRVLGSGRRQQGESDELGPTLLRRRRSALAAAPENGHLAELLAAPAAPAPRGHPGNLHRLHCCQCGFQRWLAGRHQRGWVASQGVPGPATPA